MANGTRKPLFAATTEKARKKRVSKAQERILMMRSELWPDLDLESIWQRKGNAGFATIPRTMPLIMKIINDLTKQITDGKALPAGKAYFALWCRIWDDEGMVIVDNETDLAIESGYDSERNVTTWRSHMRALKTLGFIDYKPGPRSDYQYVLILNPYKVVKQLRPQIQDRAYMAFCERAAEIGAKEMKV